MATKKVPGAPQSSPTTVPTKVSFLRAAYPSGGWLSLDFDVALGAGEEQQEAPAAANNARTQLREYLHSVLTTSNLIVLAGCGASLGKVGGPSMQDLWAEAAKLDGFADVASAVKQPTEDKWIERLLSRCQVAKELVDATTSAKVGAFLVASEKMIWKKCTEFLAGADLDAHKTFLRRMARRRLRVPRLKIFTTNYDLCFETAASALGITVIDGFSFTQPRRFDPRFFGYDVVRRAKGADEPHDFVEGVVQVLKLHGSVDWDCTSTGIEQRATPKSPCLIYPTSTKYEHSYEQPHLELMSQFQAALREPNTCLVTIGFGFNDNHLSAPIMAAVNSNPSFKLFVVDRSAQTKSAEANGVYSALRQKIEAGEADIALLNAEFAQFAEFVPELRALTPAEQIERSVKQIARQA
ncbi:MAG: SIR2 family protein [Planctomycetes bacterium]|nr:SIR2 family protein [Planctomycetota bacterium]